MVFRCGDLPAAVVSIHWSGLLTSSDLRRCSPRRLEHASSEENHTLTSVLGRTNLKGPARAALHLAGQAQTATEVVNVVHLNRSGLPQAQPGERCQGERRL
jgi:hypothetical protein